MVTGLFPPRYSPSFLSPIGFGISNFQLFMLVDLRRISPTHVLSLSACRSVRMKESLVKLKPTTPTSIVTRLTIGPPGTPACRRKSLQGYTHETFWGQTP